jgi:arabinofuranosyltransferase
VHWIAVVVAGGDWMPGYRLVAPALPLMALLAGLSVESSRLPRAAAALGLAVVCAVPALDMAAQLPEVREAGRRREEVGRPLAEAIGRRFNHVALVDAGHIPWVAGVQVFDLAGLTEPRVARAAGGHLDKRFDPRLLASEPIDAIVLHAAVPPRVDAAGRLVSLAGHPVEQRVAAHPWVRAHFRVVQVAQYAPRYHYVVLAQDDPRGP